MLVDVFNQAQTGLKHQAKRLDVFPPSIDAKSRSHGRMALSLHFEDPSFQDVSRSIESNFRPEYSSGSPWQSPTSLAPYYSIKWCLCNMATKPLSFLFSCSGKRWQSWQPLHPQGAKSYISGGFTSRFISRSYLWPTFFDGVPIVWKCQTPNLLCAAFSSFTNH